ncbi:MAG: hypothetical protein M1828_000829 [Chrysothrix sp. TS-e1954]|nr:MAG: hypothetical protein M1828_000829 [Chrysothrix sp. TS-e1954]
MSTSNTLPRDASLHSSTSTGDQPQLNAPTDKDGYSSVSSSSSHGLSSDEDDSFMKQNAPPTASQDGSHMGAEIDGSSSMQSPRFSHTAEGTEINGKVSKSDGRINLRIKEFTNKGYLSKALGFGMQRQSESATDGQDRTAKGGTLSQYSTTKQLLTKLHSKQDNIRIPKLNVVVMVIGSRGDIQPFIKVGKILREEYGHRVRIATHATFKDFVERDCGLEFFNVGGDPSELMAFMVKNPGLLPNKDTLMGGEVGRRRAAMSQMFEGFWRACIDSTDGDSYHDIDHSKEPFVSDCIIANPPSFAHVHCAERLGVPLHIMFTFPYTATQSFPHPLANIKSSAVDTKHANYMSYPLVEMITWQGLGDLINRFRDKSLGLDPVSTVWAPGQLHRLKVPHTYMWSPALVPKPPDWGREISISGFVFLELASSFQPPDSLARFLEDGDPPIYIGFGSIVVDDPSRFTQLIFDAVRLAEVRALVNKGWGGLGDEDNIPDYIYMLDNTPHDWLFPRCKAVVHHGGAGTTAIGLKLAKPTMIVPFFGDQPFWGAMVASAKAGAHDCTPYKSLTVDKFAEGIRQCLEEEAQHNVQKIADSIAKEGDGAANAVKYFHASLPLSKTRNYMDHELKTNDEAMDRNLRCSILADHAAVWKVRRRHIRLSAAAAELAVRNKQIKLEDLKLYRQYDWNDFQGPGTALYGLGEAFGRGITGFGRGVGEGAEALSKDVKWRRARRKERRDRASSAGLSDDASLSSPSISSPITSPSMTSPTSSATTKGSHLAPPSPAISSPTPTESPTTATPSATLSPPQRPRSSSSTLPRDLGRSATSTLGSVSRVPFDLVSGLGTGLHNTPHLWSDNTVRRPPRITGLSSGLRASGEAAAYNIYDSLTGVVTQPYQGAKEEGALGFVKGTGKGLAGLLIKQAGAAVEPVGRLAEGVRKEVTGRGGVMVRIRQSRIEQGRREVDGMGEEERAEFERRCKEGWREVDIEEEEVRSKSFRGKMSLGRERSRSNVGVQTKAD